MTTGLRVSISILPFLVVACASSASQSDTSWSPPPAWVDGCNQAAELRGDWRLLVGAACMDNERLPSAELRISRTGNLAAAQATKLNDQYVAALMRDFETTARARDMRKVAAIVEQSLGMKSRDQVWRSTGDALVCSRVEIDLQRDLLDRLAAAGLDEGLVAHVRAGASSAFDELIPAVDCEPVK